MPECQSGDAGAIPADRTNFQFNTRRAPACAAESPKLRLARGSTETPCHFQNCGVAKWEGSGLISRPFERVRFPPLLPILGRSIIQEVSRPCKRERARCKAAAVHHFQSTSTFRGGSSRKDREPACKAESSRTESGALPDTAPFHGLLAQPRRATACRAEGRGSNARTGRQFSHEQFARRGRQQPASLGTRRDPEQHRGARPFQLP